MKSESDISKEFSCSENSELEPPELAFKKIMRQSLQAGYREGADEARQKSFQQYFDKGYENGLLNGFRIGVLKAEEKLHHLKPGGLTANELKTSRQGMCVLCKDKELVNAPLEKIIEKQQDILETTIQNNS